MSSTLEASVFIGKNYSEHLHSIKNTGNNLTLKQMFDISGKLIVGQSDEILGVTPINLEVWTEHPHTSHFLAFACTHFNVARDIGSRCLARITSCHQAFGCAFDLILFDPLLCTLHRLSHLPFHSLVLHLHLTCAYFREWGVRHFAENNPVTGRFFMENYLWSVMKKSSFYPMQRFMYFRILCYVLERWIRTQHQTLFGKTSWVGSKIHHNTELWKQSTESQWNSSGIYLPRIHHIAALLQSPRVHDQNGQSITIQRTNYLHVDVQWHHMGIWRQWTGMHC